MQHSDDTTEKNFFKEFLACTADGKSPDAAAVHEKCFKDNFMNLPKWECIFGPNPEA